MTLGAFSLSLSVKDLDVSRKFYETRVLLPLVATPAQNT